MFAFFEKKYFFPALWSSDMNTQWVGDVSEMECWSIGVLGKGSRRKTVEGCWLRVEGAPESDVNATLPSGKIRRAGGRRSGGYESDDAHLDGVNGFVAGPDGTDDDDGAAFAKPFLVEEGLDGEADVFVEVNGIKLGDEGENAP